MDFSEHLQGILDTLPTRPGCYLMKNDGGKIIYVGKAINLRSRVRSYFHASADHDSKTRQLVRNIRDIEWIVVDSELEALILEMNLIKKHQPYFNVRLKDDKRYPYIKVHAADPFPKVTISREMIKDGSRYFGPYTSVWAVHQTLDLLRKIFRFLSCDREITGQDKRACLYYDIKLCSAPCIGMVSKEEYNQMIEDLGSFLEGKTDQIVKRLTEEMQHASEELQFEKAASLRDQVRAIDKVVEKQKVVSSRDLNSDVVAMAREDGEACVQIFFIRSGKMIGREYFILEGTSEEKDEEIISQFIKQFYTEAANIPPEVLLPREIEEMQVIKQWLHTRRNCQKVEITVPRRGEKQQLIQLASENAIETLKSLRARWESDTNRQSDALAEIQNALQMEEVPNRIECYDISNTQGTASVGSMVVFEQGVPSKKHYRRFNIKNVSGPDDFASMEEVLRRRFKRWISAQEASKLGEKIDPSFAVLPDLLIVDGGKGQLTRAMKIIDEFELNNRVLIAGLAKQNEELFLPGKKTSILLPRHSQGLYLVQRIRDEAHRFAITAHRKRRLKQGMASLLDAVPGIGPSRRKALLKHFGSIKAIKDASLDELMQVSGINEEVATSIKVHLDI